MGSIRFNNQSVKQGLFDVSTVAAHPLGFQLYLDDGRAYRYGRAGAVALTAGNLCQGILNVTNHVTARALDTPGIGTNTVQVTLGATAATEDQYAEGFLVCDATVANGGGATHKIKSHPSVLSGGVMFVQLYDNLWEDIAAANTASLISHPGAGVIVQPGPSTQALYGVASRDIPIANYGWFQFRGICGVLTNGAVVVSNQVIASITVAGAVEAPSGTYAVTSCPVGRATYNGGTTLFSSIDLNII